jgi:hypothetical protein
MDGAPWSWESELNLLKVDRCSFGSHKKQADRMRIYSSITYKKSAWN